MNKKISPSYISLKRFIVLSIATFGIYELIWLYKNWRFLRFKLEIKVSPLARAIFAILFMDSFARYLKKFLKSEGVNCTYSPSLIAISYILIFLLSRLPNPYWIISVFTFLPMLPLVEAVNSYQKQKGDFLVERLTWWQSLLIILSLILVFILFLEAIIYFLKSYL